MVIHVTMAIFKGHCPLGRLSERFGISTNDFSRSCKSEEVEETVLHLVCQCLALVAERRSFLISIFVASLTDLSNIKIAAMVKIYFRLKLESQKQKKKLKNNLIENIGV